MPKESFEIAVKKCEQLLGEFKTPIVQKEIQKLTPSTPEETAKKELLTRRGNALSEFKGKLKEDICTNGYPLPIVKRGGQRLEGGVYWANIGDITVSTASGPSAVVWTEISPASLLEMSSYFLKKETNSNLASQKTWLAGVAALTFGFKTEGKALVDEAVKLKPSYRDQIPIVIGPDSK